MTISAFTFLAPGTIQASVVIRPRAAEVQTAVDRSAVMRLPFAAGHVAVHWAGHPEATVAISLSSDGNDFGPPTDVGRDEVGEHRGDGETYGAILPGRGATSARVTSDRAIGRISVLVLADGERVVEERRVPASAGGAVAQPPIVSRAQWGADESLRFRGKKEVWPPTFHPVQKLIVHHTAGQNADPNPPATIRSIYYYHAITQRWGDIGYNFLIDEAGTIYKGRHSHTTVKTSATANDDTLDGENASGHGVTAGHSYGFNAGTVGVALLGTLSVDPPTPAAEGALERFLAWKAGKHGLPAEGESVYTNPVNGDQKLLANITAHRDVSATECPGEALYAMLPQIRRDVALLMASSP
ncbi:MAG: N-acetylmuramoyl-L-alanine amidase [Actinomycetota bacterium]|nr:N-acetylmuramoyl-L-alanine amidase [Actinomycetota bacterium]